MNHPKLRRLSAQKYAQANRPNLPGAQAPPRPNLGLGPLILVSKRLQISPYGGHEHDEVQCVL